MAHGTDTPAEEASSPSARVLPALRNYLFGVLMGGADVIPGVSGGTMALIVGIYTRLIAAVGQGASALGRLLRADVRGFTRNLRSIEWTLVIPLGLGILTALVAGAAVIPGLLEDYPAQMRGLFFGLIAASIWIPWRRIRRRDARTALVVAVAAVAAFLFTGLPDNEVTDPALWRVFGAAALAICAMILPGVSGAFLLLIVGMYEPTLDAAHERDVVYLGVFALGVLTGISLFSTALKWLLDHAHDLTMAVLVGLMAGSLRALWPFQEDDRSLRLPQEGDPVILVALLALVGAVLLLGLAQIGLRAEAAEERQATEAR